jgi:hypothetical protein
MPVAFKTMPHLMTQIGQAGDAFGVYDTCGGSEFGASSQLTITGIFGLAKTGLLEIFHHNPLYVFWSVFSLCFKNLIVFSGQQSLGMSCARTQHQYQHHQ